MPTPTPFDKAVAAIEDLHGCVIGRLRTYHHAGRDRDPASIRQALKDYADLVVETVNGDGYPL
jgi:hypothetical protein